MHISSTALLGVAFLALSIAATFTMFQFWGYEYDEVKKKSSCPQWKMNIHRGIGFAYIIVYVLMMTEMVPRIWEYQVEFPVRTVVHILLGTTIGVILIIKVSIIRFFRHFEEWMPVLGVSLLLCSVLLGVMSLPAFFRERALAQGAVGGGVYSVENRERIDHLLPKAGFPDGVDVTALSTVKSLEKGRHVLLDKCVACHDLKTIITKPRTPSDWVRTSKRMVKKPSLGGVITELEGHQAATYLIAITPDLQRSAKLKRHAAMENEEAKQAAIEVLEPDAGVAEVPTPIESTLDAGLPAEEPSTGKDETETPKPKEQDPPVAPVVKKPKPVKKPFNMAKAKELYKEECSQCHDLSDVTDAPPGSRKEVNQLMRRMVENGLELGKKDLSLLRGYLVRRFVK